MPGSMPPRALRRLSVLVTTMVVGALAPLVPLAGPVAAVAGRDPGGNNGTVKIVGHGELDSIPNNDPHVGCTFDVEWYGFDKGQSIDSRVQFEMQSPTSSVDLTVDGPEHVFVGGDPATGAGAPTGLDGRQAYNLTFDGPPHPLQGYHLKLTISTPGSQGNDKKYKVFWVQGCDPYQPPVPGISLEKTVTDSGDPDTTGALGERLTYSFAVTNVGNVPLTDVTLTDAKLAMTKVACVANLAVGQTRTCPTRSYVVAAGDIAAGRAHNTATAVGRPPTGPEVTDDDDAVILTPARPAIVLDKSVADSSDADSVASVGETLTYAFVVTNTGNVPLTDVAITDARLGTSNLACVADLAVGASAGCPVRTYVVTAADVSAGRVHNTAIAKGAPPTGAPVQDDDDADIPTQTNAPSIDLEKSVVDSNDADRVGSLGETLTYTFVVTNTGNVPLANITLTDARLGLSNVACVATLAVGQTKTCPTRTLVVTPADILAGEVHNTASIEGTPSTGGEVTDHDDATISTPAEPAIRVEKSVADTGDADTVAGLGETLTYTFKVTNTGNVPLTGVVITDARLGMTDVPCVASLGVGQAVTCPAKSYTVTSSDITAGSIRNIATATGTPPSDPGVTDDDDATIATQALLARIFLDKQVFDSDDTDDQGSLGETLTYTFHVANTGNVDLTDVAITDPMFGLTDVPCVTSLAAGATTDCPLLPAHSHTVTRVDVDRGSVENTATVSGTPPTGPPVTDDDTANIRVLGAGDDVDLVLEKSADVTVAGPGDAVTYTINVRNTGPGDAQEVVVTDVLPQGTKFVSSTSSCTFVGGTVTCPLGTIEAGDDRNATVIVKMGAAATSTGDTQHQHQLDYTKVESHVSAFAGETSGTTQCPAGYVATDGSVRLDHVDQGAGGFEDVEVVTSTVTADGQGWTGTVRNGTTGQVQAKVMVVCASERTVSGESHGHPLVVMGPTASPQTFGPGRHTVALTCPEGSYPVRPSYAISAGNAVVGGRRTAAGWQFVVDVAASASGTFGIHCLSSELGTEQGHSHRLQYAELSDTVPVPAGGTVERQLTCSVGHKGIVAWADLDPGLVSRGNDPQPITRLYRFHNPTSAPLTARFGLLCASIRTRGEEPPGETKVTNTAWVVSGSNDVDHTNDSASATVTVSPTGVVVAPRAAVVTAAGRTSVALKVAAGARRTVTLRLVAAARIGGTGLAAGAVLASRKVALRAGQATVRLPATRATTAKALRAGRVSKAKIVLIRGGQTDVRAVRLRS